MTSPNSGKTAKTTESKLEVRFLDLGKYLLKFHNLTNVCDGTIGNLMLVHFPTAGGGGLAVHLRESQSECGSLLKKE